MSSSDCYSSDSSDSDSDTYSPTYEKFPFIFIQRIIILHIKMLKILI